MAASNLEWLRERLQEDRPRPAAINPARSGAALSTPQDDGGSALELVYQAAEMIQGMTDRAGEAESRARWIVENALNKLEAAESRHQVEQMRQKDKLDEAAAELAEAGKMLKQLQARLAATEAELAATEARAHAAEARATEAKEALLRIEDAIRVHLLRGGQAVANDFSAAA
jgi:chromosome segregation ATPase